MLKTNELTPETTNNKNSDNYDNTYIITKW